MYEQTAMTSISARITPKLTRIRFRMVNCFTHEPFSVGLCLSAGKWALRHPVDKGVRRNFKTENETPCG